MDVPITFLTADYFTDAGDTLLLHRPVVSALFPAGTGQLPRRCIVDTGAPLSIVPYDLWHVRSLQWTVLSKSLRSNVGRSVLTWQGVPCELGQMYIDLAGPRLLVAKFALQPTKPIDVILGINFIADNRLEMGLNATTGTFDGKIVV